MKGSNQVNSQFSQDRGAHFGAWQQYEPDEMKGHRFFRSGWYHSIEWAVQSRLSSASLSWLVKILFQRAVMSDKYNCRAFVLKHLNLGIFPGGSDGKASAYNAGDLGSIPGSGRSPGEGNGTPLQSSRLEDLLEKAMAPHSSTLAWKIPWMEEPGRLQSMGLQRVGHDWATSLLLSFTSFCPLLLYRTCYQGSKAWHGCSP